MSRIHRFGHVEVRLNERALRVDGKAAPLGARAWDVLQALIERRDQIVTKNELLEIVWPGLVVEENNLQVQVSALRKLLGAHAIATIPGRGYQFSLSEDAPADNVAALPKSEIAPAEPIPAPSTGSPLSIAVLPFLNLSNDPENEYFADGLAEELLNVIARMRGLRVAARTSSFAFKGKNVDVRTIASQLNVATLLEGSVRKAGNRVRIAAQLISAGDGFQLWSETYDRTLDDIFAVQDDIAQAVVKALKVKLFATVDDVLIEAEVKAASRGRAGDVEAHRLRLQGRHLYQRRTRQDRDSAISYFERALAIDPTFAAAWADLARAIYWQTANGGAARSPRKFQAGFLAAKTAAERALALEPDLAEAHLAMSFIRASADYDMRGSEESIRTALALAPEDAEIVESAAKHMLVRCRFDEALTLARRAAELDPLNDGGIVIEARVNFYVGKLSEAEAGMRRARELNPSVGGRSLFLCFVLLAQGKSEEAAATAAEALGKLSQLMGLAIVRWTQGRREEADRALAELKNSYTDIADYSIAEIHAHRGEIDAAFEWLERGFNAGDSRLHWAKADTFLFALHDDPRWPRLMHKLGFED